jgi:hypothetical protein
LQQKNTVQSEKKQQDISIVFTKVVPEIKTPQASSYSSLKKDKSTSKIALL